MCTRECYALSVKIVLVFNKSLLLNTQEQRGAYWIKKYEEAIKAFEQLYGEYLIEKSNNSCIFQNKFVSLHAEACEDAYARQMKQISLLSLNRILAANNKDIKRC